MLTEWILILTVMAPHGAAIDHISGLDSFDQCTTIGSKWLMDLNKQLLLPTDNIVVGTFICAEDTKHNK